MGLWDTIAENKIRQAIAEGQFDGLPGTGKPLEWPEQPFPDPDWRMAFHLLKSNGYVLPWMELRAEIEAGLQRARSDLALAWNQYRNSRAAGTDHPSGETQWDHAVQAFHEKVNAINTRISSYNLQVPGLAFQRVLINLEKEITQIQLENLADLGDN